MRLVAISSSIKVSDSMMKMQEKPSVLPPLMAVMKQSEKL